MTRPNKSCSYASWTGSFRISALRPKMAVGFGFFRKIVNFLPFEPGPFHYLKGEIPIRFWAKVASVWSRSIASGLLEAPSCPHR